MNYRYKLTIEYDGSRFDSGWQKQNTSKTSVQGTLETAMYKLTQEITKFYCAGRTDKGVHALGQIVHVDLARERESGTIYNGMNAHLRDSGCRILHVEQVGSDFHARFCAKMKKYTYVISHSRICSVFDERKVWWIHKSVEFDVDLMQTEAQSLVGLHDFASFRDSSCQAKGSIRQIESIDFNVVQNKIYISFKARSFLHKQIRIMVGTLFDIARGHLKNDIATILACHDRAAAGQTAPGCGLFLKEIEYGDVFSSASSDTSYC